MTTPWQPGFQGVTVVPPGYNDPHNWSPAAALQLVAATPAAGVPLVSGTPNILTWTAPNDNQMHGYLVFASQNVKSLETGGAVGITATDPSGVGFAPSLFPGGSAAGLSNATSFHLVAPGTTVTVKQTSGLTGGSAAVWAQMWAA